MMPTPGLRPEAEHAMERGQLLGDLQLAQLRADQADEKLEAAREVALRAKIKCAQECTARRAAEERAIAAEARERAACDQVQDLVNQQSALEKQIEKATSDYQAKSTRTGIRYVRLTMAALLRGAVGAKIAQWRSSSVDAKLAREAARFASVSQMSAALHREDSAATAAEIEKAVEDEKQRMAEVAAAEACLLYTSPSPRDS
eukprot:TRINITY_DN4837_c0_g1_i1.p1 TRINITY_DN4837_c0_g1~~TRINITY_DN4837_c0_g1_i1.p1  ORF type:complete len:202 (-),score=52.44 TRINITY_DN4837_c0_g1_i1:111-716(-)